MRLGLAEALGVAQGLDRGVDLGVGERALGHPADNRRVRARPSSPPCPTAPGAPASSRRPPCDPLAGRASAADRPRAAGRAETADDAGVYRLADDLAIVPTVDFFTPIVDDPYDFGRIAATNALSDVYAMGARPLTAPEPRRLLARRAGRRRAARDPARRLRRRRGGRRSVVGGHSIDDPEPKYGMAVTGTVHPDRLLRNSGAAPGDELWLSKPVGGGVATTAAKRGRAGRT